MRNVLYGLTMYMLTMVCVLSAADRSKGGSAQLPRRSLQQAGGLASSASHGNLQDALLSQVARLRASDDDLEIDFGTGESSRAESLTLTQQYDHDIFDVDALRAQSLVPSTTSVVIAKVVIDEMIQKDIARDVALLEPTLKKFFETLPSDRRGLKNALITKHLISLLQEKNNLISRITLSDEIKNKHKKQGHCCCVIL